MNVNVQSFISIYYYYIFNIFFGYFKFICIYILYLIILGILNCVRFTIHTGIAFQWVGEDAFVHV